MSDDREYVLVGDHAENLHSGVQIGQGDRVLSSELDDHDHYLIDEGRLVDVADFDEPEADGPTLTELRKRASELDIDGRTKLNRAELVEAIAAAEAGVATETAPDRSPDITVGGE